MTRLRPSFAAAGDSAESAGFPRPARVSVARWAALGVTDRIPAVFDTRLKGISGPEFGRQVTSWQTVLAVPQGRGTALTHKVLLSAEPRILEERRA